MNPTGNPSKKIKTSNQNSTLGHNNSSQQPIDSEHQSVEESITDELKNRMLVSGEWLRLQKMLMTKLKGSEWEENLRCEAETRALEQDTPNLSTLVNHLRPIAQNTIPIEIREEISCLITNFIKGNVTSEDDDIDEDS